MRNKRRTHHQLQRLPETKEQFEDLILERVLQKGEPLSRDELASLKFYAELKGWIGKKGGGLRINIDQRNQGHEQMSPVEVLEKVKALTEDISQGKGKICEPEKQKQEPPS